MKRVLLSSIVVAAVIFSGCEDGKCCQNTTLVDNIIDEQGNATPVANITNPTIINDGTSCTLTANGSSSTDSDGTVERYVWTVDGTEVSSSANIANLTVPCSTEAQLVCLTVADNEGGESFPTCTEVSVIDNTPDEPETSLIPPTAVITFSKNIGEDAHTFSCIESYDNDDVDTDGNPDTDPQVVSCDWHVYKTFPDGSYTAGHDEATMNKWINTSDVFSEIHVTLTVTDDDGQTDTLVKSYKLPEDLD